MGITKETMDFVNSVMNDTMSNEDRLNKCMALTVDLWNCFKSVEDKHPSDELEMCRDIHDIQNRIFALAHKFNVRLKD